MWRGECKPTMLSPPFIMYYMGCCNDCLTCDVAFNAVMPLSRASTRGSYSRIEGVTVQFLLLLYVNCWSRNLDIVLLSGYATIFLSCLQSFWAFIAVMLSESSQVSKQSDAFANPFFPFPMSSLASLTTLIGEMRYSIALTYMLELLLWP